MSEAKCGEMWRSVAIVASVAEYGECGVELSVVSVAECGECGGEWRSVERVAECGE